MPTKARNVKASATWWHPSRRRISNGCDAVVLTRFCWLSGTNIHETYKHLPNTRNHITWWSTLQDRSPEPLFGLLNTHTHTDKNVENIISAFAVTAGKSGNANLYSPLKW